jgi:hypothetical protein
MNSLQGFSANTLQPRHFAQGSINAVPLSGSSVKQEMKEFSPIRTASRPIQAYSINGG